MDFFYNGKLIGALNENILSQRVNNGDSIEREVIDLPLSFYSVICNHCGKVYDIRKAEIVLKYNSITEFISPCCGIRCDNRPFKKDFTYLKDV